MGLFDDLFGVSTSTHNEAPSGDGIFGSLFGSGQSQPSGPSLFGGYQEPILPTASQARGYGGSMHDSVSAADKSCLMDGIVTDPDTGYVGTPSEIYDMYIKEGRNPSRLVKRFHKW